MYIALMFFFLQTSNHKDVFLYSFANCWQILDLAHYQLPGKLVFRSVFAFHHVALQAEVTGFI